MHADHHVADAKTVCGECPLIAACRDRAVATTEPWGVWGGLTPVERERHRTGTPVVACAACGLDCVPAAGNRCGDCEPPPQPTNLPEGVGLHDHRDLITSLSLDGWTVPDIAALIGCNRESVRRAQVRWQLPNTPAPMGPRPRRPLMPCGTAAAYQRHRRNGEDCAACKAANARRVQDDWHANPDLRRQQQQKARRARRGRAASVEEVAA